MRMLRNGNIDANARYQAQTGRVDVVSMQGARICIAILGISFRYAVIVKEIMGVMRVPVRRILMGMHLDHRNSGQNQRHQNQGEYTFAHQV